MRALVLRLMCFAHCLMAGDRLVDIQTVIPDIVVDCRYATTKNVVGKPIYPISNCYLLQSVAFKLAQVQRSLKAQGYGLLVWDAYRPLSAQKLLWESATAFQKKFFANPSMGGRHTRGTTVDVTLISVHDGSLIEMGTDHDDFTEKAAFDCSSISPKAKEHRTILREAMCAHGFSPLEHEWWHFDIKEWRTYPVLSVELNDLT